jgi:anti-sigma regulatory factor (Ser/Thr protein kinase)
VVLYRPVAPLGTRPLIGEQAGAVRTEGFKLPAHASAVADARQRVCGQLRLWGVADDLRETARLVVSEFFTNAVVHTDSCHVRCRLQLHQRRLRIEVTDEGGGCTHVARRKAAAEDVGGRGLELVSAVAEHWGVRTEGHHSGRMVWAELSTAAS